MKKITLKFAALLLGSALASSAFATENGQTSSSSDYELEKVLIFSRHGLRSPVEKDPQEWRNIPLMNGQNGMYHLAISLQRDGARNLFRTVFRSMACR